MMIHKIPSIVGYNYWLKRIDTQLNELTNQNSVKVPKVVKLTNGGTVEINSPLSTSFLYEYSSFKLLCDFGSHILISTSLPLLFLSFYGKANNVSKRTQKQ